MKYWLEILLIGGFIVLMMLIYNGTKKERQNEAYTSRMDSLSTEIKAYKLQLDSLSLKEVFHETKITIIKKYYDSTKVYIFNLPDSMQFNLLRANIQRHRYLLER